MKQMIVLVAMVILGVAIAGLVLGFEDSIGEVATVATNQLAGVFPATP